MVPCNLLHDQYPFGRVPVSNDGEFDDPLYHRLDVEPNLFGYRSLCCSQDQDSASFLDFGTQDPEKVACMLSLGGVEDRSDGVEENGDRRKSRFLDHLADSYAHISEI